MPLDAALVLLAVAWCLGRASSWAMDGAMQSRSVGRCMVLATFGAALSVAAIWIAAFILLDSLAKP